MRRASLVLVLAVLAGCSDQQGGASEPVAVVIDPPSSAVRSEPAGPSPEPSGAASTSTRPMLAYRHEVALELAGRGVPGLLRRHEAACNAAGQTVCQVLAVRLQSLDQDTVGGTLEMRARPDWLQRFRAGLEGDAREAGGRILSTSTSAEDLTRTIVDAQARLRAQQTLRDRLQAMLESRPGALSDLLAVEKELARVQAELDASRSALGLLQAQVATSHLTLEYAARASAVEAGVLAPVRSAGVDFLRNLAVAFGAVITVLAYVLPWLLLLAALIWSARRWRWLPSRRARTYGRRPRPRRPR